MTRIDDYEVARQSPLHFWAKASSARYLAYCHWVMKTGSPLDGSAIGVDQSHARTALFEGWLRESSLALELIVKAAFAQGEQGKKDPRSVPANHNVPQLWKMANLPPLAPDQEGYLALAYQVLQWSGRYAAPLKGKDDLFSLLQSSPAKHPVIGDQIGETSPNRWEAFDAVYLIAELEYFLRHEASEEACSGVGDRQIE